MEDIPSLLRDVARFAEAVEKLKDMVLGEGMRFWVGNGLKRDFQMFFGWLDFGWFVNELCRPK